MIDRLFRAHPRDVGESYCEHAGVAGRFGLALLAGGIKALVHAVFPFAYQTAGSDTVKRLHRVLVEQRGARRDATVEMRSSEWVI